MEDSLFRAEQRLREIDAKRAALEQELITRLEAREHNTAAALEGQLQELAAARRDELTLIDYFHERGEHLASSELFTLHYRSSRLAGGRSDDELQRLVPLWSESNQRRGVTGLLVATAGAFFGTLEGPKAAVEAVYAHVCRDAQSHASCAVMSAMRVESRVFSVGLKLVTVDDPHIAAVMEALQRRGAFAERFVPARVRDVVARGGNPLGLAPLHLDGAFVLAVKLDARCGAVHKAPRFMGAAAAIGGIVAPLGGHIVQQFGEFMTAAFPRHSTATNAVTAAKRIIDAVDFAVVAVCGGDVVLASTPQCGGIGPGLRDARRLVLLAEHARRPLIITPDVHGHSSHAQHKFQAFTMDTVLYYTLVAVGDRRLEVPNAPVTIAAYTGYGLEPVARTRENTIESAPPAAAPQARDASDRGGGALVRGALTNAALRERFRQIDVGNVGWIGKEQFRQSVAEDSAFPVFDHDLARLDKWLERCCSLGESRLSFDEFALLHLKLSQQ